jgi:hypothetical protein
MARQWTILDRPLDYDHSSNIRRVRRVRKRLRVVGVDVFCGAAGLSFGLSQSGIEIAAGIDLDPACRYPFEQNIGSQFIEKDVSAVAPAEVGALSRGKEKPVLTIIIFGHSISLSVRVEGSLIDYDTHLVVEKN